MSARILDVDGPLAEAIRAAKQAHGVPVDEPVNVGVLAAWLPAEWRQPLWEAALGAVWAALESDADLNPAPGPFGDKETQQ